MHCVPIDQTNPIDCFIRTTKVYNERCGISVCARAKMSVSSNLRITVCLYSYALCVMNNTMSKNIVYSLVRAVMISSFFIVCVSIETLLDP